MKNRIKVIASIIMVVVVLCCTIIPTFALGYGNPTDETNIIKYQALSSVNLGSDEIPYSIILDNRVGANGVYSQTDTYNNTTTIAVNGSNTKKLVVETTLNNEYMCTDVAMYFRNISFVLDKNTINSTLDTGFHAINDLYLCFDEYIGENVKSTISFDMDGYVLQDDGSYALETKHNYYENVTMAVDNTAGNLVNHMYGCRIRVDRILNTLLATRPEIYDYYTNTDGYHIGGIRNLKLEITSVNGGNNAIFVGLITTARGTWNNGNHSYDYSTLPNIVIPSANGGYEEGYNKGYDDGYDRGYDEGFEDGSTYEGDGYQDGYNEGYNVGYNKGTTEGYDSGYNKGSTDGYENGVNDGYNTGYEVGFDEGENFGFNLGYNTAINWEKQDWIDEGYNEGYNVGYGDGIIKGAEVPSDVGEFLGSSIGSFLSTKLFGDVTIGMILLIPITIPLVVMFLKLFAGG